MKVVSEVYPIDNSIRCRKNIKVDSFRYQSLKFNISTYLREHISLEFPSEFPFAYIQNILAGKSDPGDRRTSNPRTRKNTQRGSRWGNAYWVYGDRKVGTTPPSLPPGVTKHTAFATDEAVQGPGSGTKTQLVARLLSCRF